MRGLIALSIFTPRLRSPRNVAQEEDHERTDDEDDDRNIVAQVYHGLRNIA